MLNESQQNELLESLQNDIAQVGEHLKSIAEKVIDEGISEYPLFIASQEIIYLGKPIFDRDSVQLNWFFSASIIEDFVRKGIINRDRFHHFTKTYGDPRKKACIFVVAHNEGQFVFVPYESDQL